MKRFHKEEIDDKSEIVQIEDIKKATTSYKIYKHEPNKTEEKIVDIEETVVNADIFPLPKRIYEHIERIREMRKNWNASVDTMGSHMLGDRNADPKTFRYQTLVALMLSSQTKDPVCSAAMKVKLEINFNLYVKRLIDYGCTIDKILTIPDEDLSQLIYPVSFYKVIF